MTPVSLVVVLCLGLVLLLILLKVLPQVLPVIRTHCAAAGPRLARLSVEAFGWAGSLLHHGGRLSPGEAISQVAGAVVMLGAGAILGLTDLLYTLATLGPMLGMQVDLTQGLFTGMDQLAGLSVILLAVVFGLVLTDLLGWTFTTAFALIERARAGAFCIAFLGLAASVGVSVALAASRLSALADNPTVDHGMAWALNLPMIILLPLAVLLFVGFAFALTSLDTLWRAVLALVVAIGGVGLGTVMVLLTLVVVGVELALASVTAVPLVTSPLPGAVQTGLAQVKRGITGLVGTFSRGLSALVRPAARDTKPAAATATAGDQPPAPPVWEPGVSMLTQPPAAPLAQNHKPRVEVEEVKSLMLP